MKFPDLHIPMLPTTGKNDRMRIFLLILTAAAFFLFSCKKNEAVDLNPNVSSSNDILLAGSFCQYIPVMLMKARNNAAVMQGETVTIDQALVKYDTLLKTFSFTYGYVICPDSMLRVGMIYVNSNGDILTPGTKAFVTMQSYREDQNKPSMNDTIVTLSSDASGSVFECFISDGVYEKDFNYGNILFSGHYVMTFKHGQGTPEDLTCSYSGTFRGTSSQGYDFSSSITENVVYTGSCPWPVSGQTEVLVPSGTVPYGTISSPSGTCDYVYHYFIGDCDIRMKKLTRYLL